MNKIQTKILSRAIEAIDKFSEKDQRAICKLESMLVINGMNWTPSKEENKELNRLGSIVSRLSPSKSAFGRRSSSRQSKSYDNSDEYNEIEVNKDTGRFE